MRDNHDEHDYDLDTADLDQVSVAELWAARDEAAYARDLFCALLADNTLEDRGALAAAGGRRRTCRACESWADHVHDPLTDEPMDVAWPFRFTDVDMAATAVTAARVFALASVAPAQDWTERADGAARIAVELDSIRYEVILPAPTNSDSRSRRAYIGKCRPLEIGGRFLPLVHANTRAHAAIADARRYVRPTRADAPAGARAGCSDRPAQL
ncbi:hypothetical protein AWN90_06875 [Nocardia terpenica]|uniref:Uncharacterized protein n=2 Tax=Nocardia terpenica TaxID=455432 RepID=A0A164JC99_9NOCA|nr:hypothetical protein AWN90_06875 [Nocardia terpenica]